MRKCVGVLAGLLAALPADALADDPAALAARFAPLMRFDRAATTFPMSAQTYYDKVVRGGADPRAHENHLGGGDVPVYYDVQRCGDKGQVRLRYWFFYGYQHACDGLFGAHAGDWEHVMVTLSEDESRIAAVTYFMHGGWATRRRDQVAVVGSTHPMVYVGRNTHASYPLPGANAVPTCLWWGDPHRSDGGRTLSSWDHLVPLLPSGGEEWMAADVAGGFSWGAGGEHGVNSHPTRSASSCTLAMCRGNSRDRVGGCSAGASSCRLGDRDSTPWFAASVIGSCLAHCPRGTIDIGLLCRQGFKFTGKLYFYGGWTLPPNDQGLLTP